MSIIQHTKRWYIFKEFPVENKLYNQCFIGGIIETEWLKRLSYIQLNTVSVFILFFRKKSMNSGFKYEHLESDSLRRVPFVFLMNIWVWTLIH